MSDSPRVSIVMPLFNDEGHVAAALDSCLRQSLHDIEVICVDDASTDDTAAIVESFAQRDPRIRLIRQAQNRSAFQARRAGVEAARAPYLMFLDGDDELTPEAAETALARAARTDADVVGFGVEIVTPDSEKPGRFEAALQPKHEQLVGSAIIPSLFPVGEVANGHLWRYLFATTLLRQAYLGFDPDTTFYRANDLPISFLALSYAKKYVSTNERLYRYFFRRGTSGHAIDAVEHFRFLMSGIDPIDHIGERVRRESADGLTPAGVVESYESARRHIIGSVLRSSLKETSGALQERCISLLSDRVGEFDLVRAAATFVPESLRVLSARFRDPEQPAKPIKSILLTTAHLDRGGLQSVLLRQAAELAAAGYRVTIAVFRDTSQHVELPAGVTMVILGDGIDARLAQWMDICSTHAVDLIIDHHILYNDRWPWFSMAALTAGVPTIGWVHNFALRPIFDHRRNVSFMAEHMPTLLRVVTLSPTDVAFWKLHGVRDVFYLPNPPSALTKTALEGSHDERTITTPLRLAWWGRLDRPTKQVDHLIEVAAALSARNVDYRLTIIGPDSNDLTSGDLRKLARRRGVEASVDVVGDLAPHELLTKLDGSHLLVSTSAIEGYQLTIVEAQAMGMPVAMYDLPWLETVRENAGILTSEPGDPIALAGAIAALADDPERFARMSRASRDFARSSASVDVSGLTAQLIDGTLSAQYSPEPSLIEAQILITWLVRYAERGVRVIKRGTRIADDGSVRRKLKRVETKLKHVTSGPSYRIGRLLTYVPRMIRARLRK